jgi:hypothetical protein
MGKKITLFLVDDLPKGIREVRIDQWVGKAVCVPRSQIKKIKSEELENSACIYFLIGKSSEGSIDNVYVGETDMFSNRIKDHDYKKDWWDEIIFFYSVDGMFTKTSARYLEKVCIKRLGEAGKCNLMNNIKSSNKDTVPREDVSGLDLFFKNIITIMPVLGYDIFEQKEIKDIKRGSVKIKCSGNGALANGLLLEDGKVLVLKGSTAVKENTPSFEKHNYRNLKDKLIKINRLVEEDDFLVFKDDYEFNSSSAAAAVILARSAQGPKEWKDEKGNKLKDLLVE